MQLIRKTSLNQTLLVTGALLTAANVASGQGNRRHRAVGAVQSVPAQLILYCQPNTPLDQVTRLAAGVQATFKPLLLDDAYLLQFDPTVANAATLGAATAQLKTDRFVRGAGLNTIFFLHQAGSGTVEPNDTRYVKGDQYALKLINMPQAWTLQKGDVNFSVADIDTGFDPKHEDTPVISPGSFDVADNDSDVTADAASGPGEYDHGTGTSGVMLAHTNNAKGIAGVIWNRMPLFGVKIIKKGDTGANGLSSDVLVNGITYVAKNAKQYNIVACNYSIGADAPPQFADPSGAENAAIQKCITAGVHFVASAGNSAYGGGEDPGDDPGVIKVSAVGPDPTKLAVYSNFNNIAIAAPGGNMAGTGKEADGVLVMNQSTAPSPALYSFEDGTSFAAPHVTAVLALLRSVPGVDYNTAQDALLTQANHSITGQTSIPDPNFGYGLLDAYASLVKVSNVVVITEPEGINPVTNTSTAPSQQTPTPVETLRPHIRFHAANTAVVNGVPQINVTVTTTAGSKSLVINGVVNTAAVDAAGRPLVTDYYVQDVSTSPTFKQFDITFRYSLPDAPTGQQQQVTITSVASNPAIPAATSSLVFNVQPHVFPSGISMVTFPIVEIPADSPDPNKPVRDVKDILGTSNVILYRWVNAPIVDANGKPSVQGQYAVYGTGTGDTLPNLATLHPSDTTPVPVPALDPKDNPNNPANVITNASPVGLGYFINLPAGAAVRSYGRSFTQQTLNLPLHEGWNMIGDPFSFPVSFANTVIQTQNGTRYSATDAATNKLILPFLYRFVGNDYDYQTLPNGILNPWEGNWIYVIPKDPLNVSSASNALTLVVAPTQAGTVTTRGTGKFGTSLVAHRAIAVTAPPLHLSSKPEVKGPGSWAMQLIARSKDQIDAHNYIGMSSDAKDNDELAKAPKPPRVNSHITLGIQRPTSGSLVAQDLRALGGSKTWDVVVSTDQPNADVVVAWPAARTLPRGYQITMQDKTTGQMIDLHNRASYQFNSGPKAQARQFTITAQPGNSGNRVVFNSVLVTQRSTTRDAGVSIYNIEYNVSHESQVDVSIMGTGGRIIAQIDSGRAAAIGANHAVWNGRDNQNRAVPAGPYIVRLRAVTTDGKVTQYHYPLTITGR